MLPHQIPNLIETLRNYLESRAMANKETDWNLCEIPGGNILLVDENGNTVAEIGQSMVHYSDPVEGRRIIDTVIDWSRS